jgi:hypothetical protein
LEQENFEVELLVPGQAPWLRSRRNRQNHLLLLLLQGQELAYSQNR